MTEHVFDESKLSRRTLIDTSIVLRWLGCIDDERSELSKAIVKQLLNQTGRRVLVATPSVAELTRWDHKPAELPVVDGLEVVAFDRLAALKLREVPVRVIREIHKETGLTLTHLKYDWMIVACAIRHKAGLVVSWDDGMCKKARAAKLSGEFPSDLLVEVKQMPLRKLGES